MVRGRGAKNGDGGQPKLGGAVSCKSVPTVVIRGDVTEGVTHNGNLRMRLYQNMLLSIDHQ